MALIDHLIRQALSRTYGFLGWQLANEAEFKHELFHQLGRLEFDGVRLSDQVPGAPSCRLHAEGKVEIGNPCKTDLLICDPDSKREFNYEVLALLELKQRLNQRLLEDEFRKVATYRECRAVGYFITQLPSRFEVDQVLARSHRVTVLSPDAVSPVFGEDFTVQGGIRFHQALSIVRDTISDVLTVYGASREQYHSFFWCNYEHEQWRRHSFPCEGDFVAQLYHQLRLRLPGEVEIRSEVHPPAANSRVDLVVRAADLSWGIPIDVKMNWDQFKPGSRRNGSPAEPESLKIIDRLGGIAATFGASHPIVVVIQGDWRLPRDIRSKALPLLEQSPFPLELASYLEDRARVSWREIGHRP